VSERRTVNAAPAGSMMESAEADFHELRQGFSPTHHDEGGSPGNGAD